MSNEITLNANISYSDTEGTELTGPSIVELLVSVVTKAQSVGKQSIGTSESAIYLGGVSAPGWAMFVNRDTTNFLELRVASSGAKFAKLKPGEFALLRLGSGAQAPYAIADTGACQLETFILAT